MKEELEKKKTDIINKATMSQKLINDNHDKLEQIETENTKLRANLDDDEASKEKICQRCHKLVKPKDNSETACIYHPGKMKFFSCKGCGSDEYNVCCMLCNVCSKGCRNDKHVFN